MGPPYLCTEMVSAMGIKYKNERTMNCCVLEEVKQPVSMQIFGSNQSYCHWCKVVADAGADIVDIMGRPVKKLFPPVMALHL